MDISVFQRLSADIHSEVDSLDSNFSHTEMAVVARNYAVFL